MRRTLYVVIFSLSLTLMSAAVYAQVITPVDVLEVFDSNNTRVGVATGGFQVPFVSLEVDGVIFQLFVSRDSLLNFTTVFFEAADCTTPPLFLQADFPPGFALPLPLATVFGARNTLFLSELGGIPLTARARSDSTGVCTPLSPPLTTEFRRTTEILDLDDVFTPPFSFRKATTPDIGSLQEQVDALEDRVDELADKDSQLVQQIRRLKRAVRFHRHKYLTGRGKGHNNTSASTGPAKFPAAP